MTPSATKAAAKQRRIHVSTRGREITWVRIVRGEQPVTDEHHERHRHEHRAELSISGSRVAGIRRHELRQEREEEDRQLGVQDVDQDRLHDHLQGRACAGLPLYCQCAQFLQRHPRHPEQIGDAGIFEHLEGDRAGVQECGEAEDRRRHVRHDAERAATPATTLALPPRDRPVARVNSTPVPGRRSTTMAR